MLTDIDEMARREPYMKSLQSVVSWQAHGKAFRVHDKKGFIDVVMPTWFSRIKYSSWVRQLSSYGFQKVHTNGADKGGQSILNGSHLLLLPSTFIIHIYLSHFPTYKLIIQPTTTITLFVANRILCRGSARSSERKPKPGSAEETLPRVINTSAPRRKILHVMRLHSR